ncbi:hypothetical protein [Bacteroides sp.]|uniref:hypothetical protein n=1 Tax=Bacteroides sp. TaxID=29523 RepID=UPI0026121A62|nr:hypothetical protein [Bacteroides sp.]
MKYLITKIEYITGDTRRSEKVNIETDDIEVERNRLRVENPCYLIYFTYTTVPC